MSTLTRTRLRLAGDAANFDAPLDILRRATPQFWRGNDVQFEIAVFFNGGLQDISNLASLTLEVRPLGSGGAAPDPGFTPLMGATVTSFDNTTTLDTWNAGTKQHAVVAFTAAQSNIVAGPAWLSVFVITNDSPGRVITLCAGPVRVLEDGSGLASTPSPAGDTFYTAAQSDARFAPIGGGGSGGGTWGSITGTLASQTDLNTALSAKAPLASPTFTGTPMAPTVSPASDSSTKVATTAFVQAAIAAAGGGSGSVTSVALSVPSFLSVAGSPITTSGTLAVSLANQNANMVFAGPGSGSAAAPTFRALVAADIPAIAQSGVTGLTSALAALAPLASPAFTGTPTAPTPGGSDNSTKIATTAWVQAFAGVIATDGSGHYWLGTGGAGTLASGATAIFTVNGGFCAKAADGAHLMTNSAATWDDVLHIQRTTTSDTYMGTGSAIDFRWNPNLDSSIQIGGVSIANKIAGAVGCENSGSYPVEYGTYLSGSPPFDPTTLAQPTAGVGRVSLVQEGIFNSGYKYRQVIHGASDWSIQIQDPNQTVMAQFLPPSNFGATEFRIIGTSAYSGGSAGSGSAAQFSAKSSDGDYAVLGSYNSAYSYHIYPASGSAIFATGSGGLVVMASNAAGVIRFATGGDNTGNERLRIDASGNLLFSNAVTSAPSVTLASGQYQITVYDNGSAPVLRVRYNTGSAVKVGDLTLT